MKLTEFNAKQSLNAKKALKEHYNTSINVERLGLGDTKRMLTKVRGLISEMKSGQQTVYSDKSPSYMKLVFMEQALQHHYGELKTLPIYNQRIIIENEEVDKSQVVLAAQEMIDEMQKMIENISDMLVKELPAVVDGINSEIGTNEGDQFNQQATEALSSLQAALTQSKTGLQSAMGVITGQGADFDSGMGSDMGAGADMGDDLAGDMDSEVDMGDQDLGPEQELEEPDSEETPAVGRATR